MITTDQTAESEFFSDAPLHYPSGGMGALSP